MFVCFFSSVIRSINNVTKEGLYVDDTKFLKILDKKSILQMSFTDCLLLFHNIIDAILFMNNFQLSIKNKFLNLEIFYVNNNLLLFSFIKKQKI